MSKVDAAVIGTVFTDIKGFCASAYNPSGRNQGRVELFQGGVGRNVAENLANLGLSVRFVSSVDDGMLGSGVLSRLKDCMVDTSYVKKAQSQGMGIWMLINDQAGEQAGSLSQLPDPSYTEEMLDSVGGDIVAGADHIILEADVSAGATEKTLALARKYNKKVYALPATMEVALKMPHMLSQLECFICNDIEAGRLFHAQTHGLDCEGMLAILRQGMETYGVPSFVVTMGARGAVYCDARTGVSGHAPAMQVNVVDSSGAGDAFFSGSVAALIRGVPLDRAVLCGTRLAALTIQSDSCTCDADAVKNARILQMD